MITTDEYGRTSVKGLTGELLEKLALTGGFKYRAIFVNAPDEAYPLGYNAWLVDWANRADLITTWFQDTVWRREQGKLDFAPQYGPFTRALHIYPPRACCVPSVHEQVLVVDRCVQVSPSRTASTSLATHLSSVPRSPTPGSTARTCSSCTPSLGVFGGQSLRCGAFMARLWPMLKALFPSPARGYHLNLGSFST